MGKYEMMTGMALLSPDSAPGLLEYARQEDPFLAFLMVVGSKAVGGFVGKGTPFSTKNYGQLEAEYTNTIMEEWPAFAEEVRRRSKEAGLEKLPFATIDQDAYQYFTKRLEENIEKEENPERKKVLEGIRRGVKRSSIQLFNLIGDFLDPIHNYATMEFAERYSTESLEIFDFRGGNTHIHLMMIAWPERLANEGRFDEMNDWMKEHIVACPKDALADVLGMYDSAVSYAIDEEGAPKSINQTDAIVEAWKQGNASEDMSDLDDLLSHKNSRNDFYNPEPAPAIKPVVRDQPKIYPNDPCPCGSGKKYKKCCGKKA